MLRQPFIRLSASSLYPSFCPSTGSQFDEFNNSSDRVLDRRPLPPLSRLHPHGWTARRHWWRGVAGPAHSRGFGHASRSTEPNRLIRDPRSAFTRATSLRTSFADQPSARRLAEEREYRLSLLFYFSSFLPFFLCPLISPRFLFPFVLSLVLADTSEIDRLCSDL